MIHIDGSVTIHVYHDLCFLIHGCQWCISCSNIFLATGYSIDFTSFYHTFAIIYARIVFNATIYLQSQMHGAWFFRANSSPIIWLTRWGLSKTRPAQVAPTDSHLAGSWQVRAVYCSHSPNRNSQETSANSSSNNNRIPTPHLYELQPRMTKENQNTQGERTQGRKRRRNNKQERKK